MIDDLERERLRRQARADWEKAKRLRRRAAELRSASADMVRAAEELRSRAVGLRSASAERAYAAGELRREAAGLTLASGALHARSTDGHRLQAPARLSTDAASPGGTVNPALLEALVDQTIRRWDPREEAEAEAKGQGVGLVASINMPTLVRLEQLAGSRLGYVVGANDAGAALGLAIATQPDLSIVDARLDLADGSDLAAILPFYAPRTKTLLLTDDHDLAARAQLVGADVMSRRFSDQDLLSWISNAAA